MLGPKAYSLDNQYFNALTCISLIFPQIDYINIYVYYCSPSMGNLLFCHFDIEICISLFILYILIIEQK